jgi:hypothetical protein
MTLTNPILLQNESEAMDFLKAQVDLPEEAKRVPACRKKFVAERLMLPV